MDGSTLLISTGKFGVRAQLFDVPSNRELNLLKEKGVCELDLNQGKGWAGNSVDFVRDMPDLKSIELLDLAIDDVSPISSLACLQSLNLVTYAKTPVDFSDMKSFRSCHLEWIPGSESLFEVETLEHLSINRYDSKDFHKFIPLQNLRSLAVLGSAQKTLTGISNLGALEDLRLSNLRQLESIGEVGSVRSLVRLEIQACRKIRSIAEVARLSNLEYLSVSDCSDIDSLSCVTDLSRLAVVLFYGSTNIRDGDLMPLVGKRLERVSFKDRAHYSHRLSDFTPLV